MRSHRDWAIDQDRRQIRSRERVRDLAEVYTPMREVDAMLDLIPDMFHDIDSRFLEPACGDGNFLVEILSRKLGLISVSRYGGTPHWYEFSVLRCVASIYAIDISEENVCDARERMREVMEKEFADRGYDPTPAFHDAVTLILATNIVRGDTLEEAHKIRFVEWQVGKDETFVRIPTFLQEPDHNLFYEPPEPLGPDHYSDLTSVVLP